MDYRASRLARRISRFVCATNGICVPLKMNSKKKVPISFSVDHGVTKSICFRDPDGQELEV
jgi:hypothetical protein